MTIRILGAREHNLQAIDVEIESGLTAVTGVSGSGKTSLVFDTLYYEARRRFLEVYSQGSIAERMSPAAVENITGLGPAVAVGQNLLNRNPNSTVATASGLHPFFRLLFARFGERTCIECDQLLVVVNEDQIVERITNASHLAPMTIIVPLVSAALGSHRTLLALLVETFGSEALIVDELPLSETSEHGSRNRNLNPAKRHDIDVVIGDFSSEISAADARAIVRTAISLGAVAIKVKQDGQSITMARAQICPGCGTYFQDLEPLHFRTHCPDCEGNGCVSCAGSGLHPSAASVRIFGFTFPQLLSLSIAEANSLFESHEPAHSTIRLHEEIKSRLEALVQVGLDYISLDRASPSLSRGESQRLRLAIIMTSKLEDMLHVLDEPTIGQHPADVDKLLPVISRLPGPIIFVEHDRFAIAAASQAIDLGPAAGKEGGQLLYSGDPAGLWRADTLSGRFFSLRRSVDRPKKRPQTDQHLTIKKANLRNLNNIDVKIPLGRLTVVTGVSGSGKSTLVEDVLVASLRERSAIGCASVDNSNNLKSVLVDQKPIGRNPRSNPATYTKLSDLIRDYYANATSLSASHFSFNRPEGACPSCKGMGALEIKMRYLPSTWIPCSACGGQRFSDEVLSAPARFGDRQLSIAQFLALSVSEALSLLEAESFLPERERQKGLRILKALSDVGLGYLPLGQPSPTLSGGEAQRVKLAKFLARPSLVRRLLVLDEPTTGLHPHDVSGLLVILDRAAHNGATVVVVEHNLDIIRAADWILELGPGAGPKGGRLIYSGPAKGLTDIPSSPTGQALAEEPSLRPLPIQPAEPLPSPSQIAIRNARIHNLKNVDAFFPKGALSVVTGVSGSGKSSLVMDVLEVEARRRFLESLTLYERQATREGPAALVDEVSGLGVSISIKDERRYQNQRATAGTETEISHNLALLLACIGDCSCLSCGHDMTSDSSGSGGSFWLCPNCHSEFTAQPRHFSATFYAAACKRCHGVGTLQEPNPIKLIINPEKPLCGGAMYSPGFFPKGYLCKPNNHGYDMVQALAERHNFDPAQTPWLEMSPEAQKAFLFGDPEPLEVTLRSRTQTSVRSIVYPGFYGFIRDWDVGGTYTDRILCPECQGARLRPEYLAVTLAGLNLHELSQMSLSDLAPIMAKLRTTLSGRLSPAVRRLAANSIRTVQSRLQFLIKVGLGYLTLNRTTATLSAGEAQRIKLAALLGGGLKSLTILLDEPSRGLHPSEVDALIDVLHELREQGNTVIVVEHDLSIIKSADYLLDMGPGSGLNGGQVVAQGTPEQIAEADTPTALWLRGESQINLAQKRRQPESWLTICRPTANNLKGEDVQIPLGLLVGICGVSGSGKSTLMIDTLGRALAPKKHTTSVAQEPIEPGPHDAIEGAPRRVLLLDQAKKGVVSPASFLGLDRPIRALFAESEEARSNSLSIKDFSRSCSACKGRGYSIIDMGFLPSLHSPCEACNGSGYRSEVREIRLRGFTLPEVSALTLDELYAIFGDQDSIRRPLSVARHVGLGHLVLRQPGYALSGGEIQRLKMTKELSRKTVPETLYILDEPTIGQHLEDVRHLIAVFQQLVTAGHSVAVVEHHPSLLAACDWLIELGPGGGPKGGQVIANGTPEVLANGKSATAGYLKEIMKLA